MQISPLQTQPGKKLYEAVADRVQWLVDSGTLSPGDRIPSVRRMHKQLAVSVSTVMQAYRLLEDRGLIEARPQSGYFVRHVFRRMPQEPTVSRPSSSARPVHVASLSLSLVDKLNHSGVVKLGAAVPAMELMPLKALNRILGQVLRNHPLGGHAYDVPIGCERLRIEIARRMLDAGVSLRPDDIITTCGATEALSLALQAVTQPGDTVAVETPTYYGILEKLEVLRLNSLEIATDPRDGIDLEELARRTAEQKIKVLVTVCNFSNPLGSCMPDAKKRALIALMAERGVPIIEDDVYGELYFEGTRPKSLKAYDRQDGVIYCSSFSKTISPGCRTGWCVPGRFGERVLQLKLAMTHSTPMPTQLAVAAYLKQGGYDRHLRRIRQCYRDQMRRVVRAVGEHFPPGTRVSNPRGGHVVWVEMPEYVDSIALYAEAAEHGISVAPGPIFSPAGQYRNCIRLNSGIRWSPEVEAAIVLLGNLAKRQQPAENIATAP